MSIESFDVNPPISCGGLACTRCDTIMPDNQYWLFGEHPDGDFVLCSRCLRDLAHIIDQRTARGE